MAEIFLPPVLEVILDRLASPILEMFGDLCNLKDNIEKVRRTLPMVQALLDDAEQQQLTNLAVKVWLSKLKHVTCEAEELLIEFTSSRSFMPPNAEKVREMLLNLEMIASEGLSLNLREGSASPSEWDRRETSSFVIESEVYGRDDDKEKVIQMLLSCQANQGEVPCVTIVGMGGLGKTTLAQLAFNDQRVTQYFDVGSWVFVSDCFDVKRIMVTVIESISEDKRSYSNMNALHSALWSLLRKKRYLIVLDDVWTEDPDDWEKLKPLLRGGADGSKILITTRSRKVEFMMDSPTFPYYLQGLSDDACWLLFMKRAFRRGEEEKYPALLPIGRQIVRKCGGLALAAKTLGSLLRFKREAREWLFVQDSELWKLNECGSGILPILRLSYLHLPLHLKRCFAFCSIFPRNFEFKKDKLIHLWIAEGLIHSTNEKLLEDIGNDHFNDLLWISFFEEVKHYGNDVVMGYKMHDVIYDLVRSMTGSEYTMLDCRRSSPGSFKQIRHVSVVCDFNSSMIAEELYDAKHLRTLLLFSEGNFGQLSYKLCSSFRYLIVLDLSGSGLVKWDQPITFFSCLRFLDLSYTPIKRLPPGIEYLPLQTLNLFNCYALLELPNLKKMRKLRHLNNIGCEALTGTLSASEYNYKYSNRRYTRHYTSEDVATSEKLFQSLELFTGPYELQTLPLFVVRGPFDIRFLGKLNLRGSLNITRLENVYNANVASFAELKRKECIESLGLYWGNNDGSNPEEESAVTRFKERGQTSSSRPSQQIELDEFSGEEILKELEPPHNLKRLLIKGYPGNRFPHWSLPHLNVVNLINCRKSEQLPMLGNLQFLTRLSMRGMHGVRSIRTEFYGEGSERPFTALRELVLIDFPNLEEWLSPDGGDAFPCLRKLVVKECPKLALMPQVFSIQHLELRDCKASLVHSFQNLTSLEALVIEKVRDLFSFSGAFPANNSLLTFLEIKSCRQLQQLQCDLGNLAKLKSLTIRWCEALSLLPRSLQSLGALESLEIGDCHSLIYFPEGGTKGLSNLRTLSVENCNNLISLSMGYQYLTSLENLTIMYCPSIGSFPRDVEHLSALRSLTILSCPQFMYLPEGLQNLKLLHSLEIWSCPGLKALPEWIEKLVSLRSLAISDCHKVKVLPEGIKRLKALQHLSIQDCPQLLERCREQGGEDWPKIAHVPFKHIGSAEQTNPSQAGSSSSA
ncbi:hypothetical protein UlMin_042706 [Ulmus minor]